MNNNSLKILHVGWGFIPFRGGGLIEYAEDLMLYQSSEGFNVSYFFNGRKSLFQRNQTIKRWQRYGIKCFEIINGSIIRGIDKGTSYPLDDLNCKSIEELFKIVIDETEPDIVHFHEFLFLPTSLIKIVKHHFSRIKIVFTVQDYYTLCPTLKLFKHDQTLCQGKITNADCSRCCVDAPIEKKNRLLFIDIFQYFAVKLFYFLFRNRIYRSLFCKINIGVFIKNSKNGKYLQKKGYTERRITNLQRLLMIDLILFQSVKNHEIFFRYSKFVNSRVFRFFPKHIDDINYKRLNSIELPIKIVLINVFNSVEKGATLVTELVDTLREKGFLDKIEINVYGGFKYSLFSKICEYKNIYYKGPYDRFNLNKILDCYNLGIIPSVWEESFGYTGYEMIKKGIPVIGNNLGGIPDYIIHGVTGWLNKTNTAEELAEIIIKIINNPEVLLEINRSISNQGWLNVTSKEHFARMSTYYKELIEKSN